MHEALSYTFSSASFVIFCGSYPTSFAHVGDIMCKKGQSLCLVISLLFLVGSFGENNFWCIRLCWCFAEYDDLAYYVTHR